MKGGYFVLGTEFDNITIFQLRLCLSIQEYGSFTRAAEDCHITQPTLSKKISQLEEQLGLDLFVRGKNTTIRPTPAGEVLFKEWRSILKHMERSLQYAYEIQENDNPTILFSSIPSIDTKIYIQPLVEAYLGKLPNRIFRFELMNISFQASGLLDGSIDIAMVPIFRENLFKSPPLVSKVILNCNWLAGMLPSNVLASKTSLTMHDLAKQNFILPSPHLFSDYYSMIEECCLKAGFTPNVTFTTQNHMSLPMNIRTNNEVFFVESYSRIVGDTGFVFREVTDMKGGLLLCWNENNKKSIVKDFVKYATNYFSKIRFK